ncbi:hypothetical protein pb186bvf_005114 [Paramecium bursaria]
MQQLQTEQFIFLIKTQFQLLKVFYLIAWVITIYLYLVTSYAQTKTSFNTCYNEKNVLKLDVRQRIGQLPAGSTIEDIDAQQLCREAYQYDYIWLNQLWTPSKYNYKDLNGTLNQTYDYREFENIKEYNMDPQFDTVTNLYKFQQNMRNFCLHIKFLGEFSFYVPKDSYLMQNRSTFLRRPLYESPNIYSDRYDDENFQWAVYDQKKTVPYAVPWNFFTRKGIEDMRDLIYRVIITQNKLDGIVFLQPSLGLYQRVLINFYGSEIMDQGTASLLNDFYQNFQIQNVPLSLFFMGGKDNLRLKAPLLNYLQQIYGQPTINQWNNVNFTWSSVPVSTIELNNPKGLSGNSQNSFGTPVKEEMSSTINSCIRFNWTSIVVSLGMSAAAVGIFVNPYGYYVVHDGYTEDLFQSAYWQTYVSYDQSSQRQAFSLSSLDIIEVQFEPLDYLIRMSKYFQQSNTQIMFQMKRDNNSITIPYSSYKFTAILIDGGYKINIAFPFNLQSNHINITQSTFIAQNKYYVALARTKYKLDEKITLH